MIDADTGNIHLPNGYVITPALTLDKFRQAWSGRLGWRSQMNGGLVKTFLLEVNIHFDAQRLARVSLVADLSHVTKDDRQHWIDTKAFHDALIRNDLGEPDAFTDTYGMDAPELGKAPNYLRAWGKAVSEFDYGGGDAYISVEYKNDKAL